MESLYFNLLSNRLNPRACVRAFLWDFYGSLSVAPKIVECKTKNGC